MQYEFGAPITHTEEAVMNGKRISVKIDRMYDRKPLYYDCKKMGNLLIIGGSNNYREDIIKNIIVEIISKYHSRNISFIILSPNSSGYDNLSEEYNSIKLYKNEKLFHEKMKDLMMIKESRLLFLDETFIKKHAKLIGPERIARIREIRKKDSFDNYFVIIDDCNYIFDWWEFIFDFKRLFSDSSKANINLILITNGCWGLGEQNESIVMSVIDSKIVLDKGEKDA